MNLEIVPKLLLACKHYFFDQYSKIGYSLEAEDIIYENINNSNTGIYVDIGAHHPFRFSNTYKLYRKGWSGINIDASPGSMLLFNIFRRRDINLELGVGKHKKNCKYYSFNEPALNTFDPQIAEKYVKQGYLIKNQYKIPIKSLEWILDAWLSQNKIDLLTIDVEGLDYEVLTSNNWNKYTPKTIIIEDCNFRINKPSGSKIYLFLTEKKYKLKAITGNSTIYCRE